MTGKNRVVLPVFLALGLISTNANASDPCYMEKQSGKVEGVSAEVLKRIFLIF